VLGGHTRVFLTSPLGGHTTLCHAHLTCIRFSWLNCRVALRRHLRQRSSTVHPLWHIQIFGYSICSSVSVDVPYRLQHGLLVRPLSMWSVDSLGEDLDYSALDSRTMKALASLPLWRHCLTWPSLSTSVGSRLLGDRWCVCPWCSYFLQVPFASSHV
jgi:hypothetical protein